MKHITLLYLLLLLGTAKAQSPTDGLMMPKKNICNLLQYSHSSWNEYWEGTLLRKNDNLGTVRTQQLMLMSNYGITDRLNVMAALPYIWTTNDGYFQGQKGLQDISIFLKYQILQRKIAGGDFKIQTTGGASTPVSKYQNDFLPFSIGLGSKTVSLRAILNYTHKSGAYATIQAGHAWRSHAHLHRDAYLLNNILYYTDEVPVPNVVDATARLGYINKNLQVEGWYDYSTGLTGDDIRYNEAPFVGNKMEMGAVGVFAKYRIKAIAFQVGGSTVLSGRNVGKNTTISAGLLYIVDFNKKTKE